DGAGRVDHPNIQFCVARFARLFPVPKARRLGGDNESVRLVPLISIAWAAPRQPRELTMRGLHNSARASARLYCGNRLVVAPQKPGAKRLKRSSLQRSVRTNPFAYGGG